MSNRLLTAGLVFLVLGSRALAVDTLDVQLFPLSGEIRLHNPSPTTAVPFVYYSISSSTNHVGALNSSALIWKSISDNYDASGNGFIDAAHEWSKLTASSIQLEESVVPGPGGNLAANRAISLGAIWNPGTVAYTDLAFSILQASQLPVAINIQRRVAGDYDFSNTVAPADYAVWRQNFGSTSALDADGNLNGVVDAADYSVWRANLGDVLPPPGAGAGSGQSLQIGGPVPEPSSSVLALVALAAVIACASIRPAVRRAALQSAVRR